jgi:hypothetical protein
MEKLDEDKSIRSGDSVTERADRNTVTDAYISETDMQNTNVYEVRPEAEGLHIVQSDGQTIPLVRTDYVLSENNIIVQTPAPVQRPTVAVGDLALGDNDIMNRIPNV